MKIALATCFAVAVSVWPAASADAQQDYTSTLGPPCTSPCAATVIVPAGCGSGIRVAPDPIVVRAGQSSNIRWNVTGGWQFAPSNGIFVHMATKEFSGYERSGKGDTFSVTINSPTRATFKYDINLVRVRDGKVVETCRLDPVIVNW